MSRFGCDDDDSEWMYLNWGRWEHNLRTTLAGKRGQRALAELEEALLSMPVKKLIHGRVCEIEDHDLGFGWTFELPAFCVVGLYAHHKGASVESLLDEDEYDAAGDYETAQIGEKAGMSFTMAWHLGDLNDERFWNWTPEQRWEAVLAWVQEKRAAVPAPFTGKATK